MRPALRVAFAAALAVLLATAAERAEGQQPKHVWAGASGGIGYVVGGLASGGSYVRFGFESGYLMDRFGSTGPR